MLPLSPSLRLDAAQPDAGRSLAITMPSATDFRRGFRLEQGWPLGTSNEWKARHCCFFVAGRHAWMQPSQCLRPPYPTNAFTFQSQIASLHVGHAVKEQVSHAMHHTSAEPGSAAAGSPSAPGHGTGMSRLKPGWAVGLTGAGAPPQAALHPASVSTPLQNEQYEFPTELTLEWLPGTAATGGRQQAARRRRLEAAWREAVRSEHIVHSAYGVGGPGVLA